MSGWIPMRRTASSWQQHANVWFLEILLFGSVTVASIVEHAWWFAIIFALFTGFSGGMLLMFVTLGSRIQEKP